MIVEVMAGRPQGLAGHRAVSPILACKTTASVSLFSRGEGLAPPLPLRERVGVRGQRLLAQTPHPAGFARHLLPQGEKGRPRLDLQWRERMLAVRRNPAMPTESGKPLIVISYAHADEPEHPAEGEVKWLSFVTGYLRPAIKHGAVDLWLDGLMPGGADWEREIEQKLRACDIFVLLVSRHSLASNYVVDKEIPIIRERQAKGEVVHFYPLILTPTPKIALRLVSDKNLRPRDGKPLSDYPLHERYRHMAEAADEIAEIAADIAARSALARAQPSPHTGSHVESQQSGSADQSKAKPRNLRFTSLGGLLAGR